MRISLYILFSLICYDVNSQSFSSKADSLVRLYILELPSEHSNKFDTLLTHRTKSHFSDSIDEKKYDYVYIEETFCFFTGQFDTYYNYYLLDTTDSNKEITRFKKTMRETEHVQKRKYKIWEVSDHDRKCRKKSKYRDVCEKELETSYRIITIIYKTTGEIHITLFYPPKNAKCRAVYLGGGKC